MSRKLYLKRAVGALLACCMTVLSGCSFVTDLVEDEPIEVMDFTQPLALRKSTTPIKHSPVILFLGNSMTFYNNLPSVFIELSVSGGFTPEVYELTEGNYRLELFADQTDELGEVVYEQLGNYAWDFVILQEQSGIAATMAKEGMFPPARTLDKMIKGAGAQTVFFMTWAGKDGYSFDMLGKTFSGTREEMQTRMAQNYMAIADELNARLAPAGIAFMRCYAQHPEIELWDEDLSHPSQAGTYLAACVFYATLYEQSPEGLDYLGELDQQTAQILQQIAAKTVL